jgi:hypothetical protein
VNTDGDALTHHQPTVILVNDILPLTGRDIYSPNNSSEYLPPRGDNSSKPRLGSKLAGCKASMGDTSLYIDSLLCSCC